jgi:hypothetical protein
MSTVDDSIDARSITQSTFVSRHPIVAAISLAIILAGCAGVIAFGYVSILNSLRLNPRSDAVAIVGVLGDLLLASGVIVLYLRQSSILEDGLRTLQRQTATREEVNVERRDTLKELQKQTKSLQEGMEVLAEQQRVQRALYTPSLDIDHLRPTNRESTPDTVQFSVSNLSAGDATNVTLRSELNLIDAPDEYSVSGRRATCPLTRADRQRPGRVPPREELDFETNVVVGVTGNTGWGENTFECDFSDAMCVFDQDGVETIELSLELVYEDVFGEEYTEQIESSMIIPTQNTTFGDVLQEREQSDSESTLTDEESQEPSQLAND